MKKKQLDSIKLQKSARRKAEIESGVQLKLGTRTHKSVKDYVRKPKHPDKFVNE